MEEIVLFILELLFEFAGDALFDRAASKRKRSLSSRRMWWSVAIGAGLAVGLIGGFVWGRYASEQLDGGIPRTLWVSLGSGLLALFIALVLRTRTTSTFGQPDDPGMRSPAKRFTTIGGLNLVVAAGIAWGTATVV